MSLAKTSRLRNSPRWVSRDDIFEWATQNEAKFTLDIKNGFDFNRTVFERALDLVNHYDFTQRVMLIGWEHHAIRWVKQTQREVTTRIILRGRPVNLVEVVRASRADALSLSYDLASKAEVDALHAEGIALTIADMFEPDFARVMKIGADMVSWGDPIVAIRETSSI